MTSDRDRVGDTVMDAAGAHEVAREAVEVAAEVPAEVPVEVGAGAVPAPRPEVLARVLAGLRDLPAARREPRPDADGPGDAAAMPLPRRRS